jgi:hypothetical protein
LCKFSYFFKPLHLAALRDGFWRFANEADFERAGGPDGRTSQQGFFVYRRKNSC